MHALNPCRIARLAATLSPASREPRRARLHLLIEAGATVRELEAVFGAREAAFTVPAWNV